MTVVLVDPLRPSLVPVEAVELLAGDVQYTEEMPIRVPWSLPSARPSHSGEPASVLLSSDPEHPLVKARVAAGETVIAAPAPQPGERIVEAVSLMDRLRTSGPWEQEQTHDSLRRYLLEETYELFDAIRTGDGVQLREELGDILLQVLFHARIAQDADLLPFGIDDVADSLVRKLVNRAPGVLSGQQISLDEQLAQWEERKAQESLVKARRSTMDDVPTSQPALMLTQKVYERVVAAGMPTDLIPEGMASIGLGMGGDAESVLRAATLHFMDVVRSVEQAIIAGRRGPDVPEELHVTHLGTVTEEEWRAYWPTQEAEGEGEPVEGEPVEGEPVEGEEAEAEAPVEEPEAEADEPVDEDIEPEVEAAVEAVAEAAAEATESVEATESAEPEFEPLVVPDVTPGEVLESLEPIAPEASAEAKSASD